MRERFGSLCPLHRRSRDEGLLGEGETGRRGKWGEGRGGLMGRRAQLDGRRWETNDGG